MLLLRFVVSIFPIGTIILGAGVVSGQNFPNKPIRIVTPGTGGGGDFAARVIAQGLTGSLGQQVVVDNRPSGVIPGDIVSKALPDGYTLLLSGNTLWIGSLLQDNPLYDPVRDFSPITLAIRSPTILVVHPSVPVKSVKELIALTKARPGELNYSSGATGSAPHLAGELFKSMARVNMVRIPYKNGSLELSDLIGGQVQLSFATAASKMPYVKSGRLRALAVTTAQPSALFPELPTVAASGLPGYESVAVYGLLAPAKTLDAIINRLNQEIVRVLNKADVKERFFNSGAETVGSSPEEFAVAIKSEMARLGKVIRDAGIRGE